MAGAAFAALTGLVGTGLVASAAPAPVSPRAPGDVERVDKVTTPVGNTYVRVAEEWDGSLLFTAQLAGGDGHMWRADPDGAPRRVFADAPFDEWSVQSLTPDGDRFFFAAQDLGGESDRHLWVSDGTEAGTRQLTDFDTPGADAKSLTMIDGQLVFLRYSDRYQNADIWTSDGTPEGTVRRVEGAKLDAKDFGLFKVFGDKILTTHYDGQRAGSLWITDLTTAGTRPIDPGRDHDVPSGPEVIVGDQAFFRSNADGKGHELWVTDGTAAGTRIVADVVKGERSSHVRALTRLGDDRVVFLTKRPVPTLWVTDGTKEGTRKLKAFPKASTVPWKSLQGRGYEASVVFGNKVVFTLKFGKTRQLWRTNGTAKGTKQLTDFDGAAQGVDEFALAVAQDRVWFTAGSESDRAELWSTGGKRRTTQQVSDLNRSDEAVIPSALMVSAVGRLWFIAESSDHYRELWRTTPGVKGLAVNASAKQKQKQKRLRARIRVKAGVAATMKVRGKVKVKGGKAFRLKKKSVRLLAGKKKTVALKLAKGNKKVLKAVKKFRRSGTKPVTALVRIVVTAGPGQTATRLVTIRLV